MDKPFIRQMYQVSDQQGAIFDAATKLVELIKAERGVKPSRPQAMLIAINEMIDRLEAKAAKGKTTK